MRKTADRAAQLAELRVMLLSERSKLISDRRDDREVLQTPQNIALDDQASLLHEQFVTLAHHRRDRETLALIDAALERIDRDEFGFCARCEMTISSARLRAVPWASFCVPCQERTEESNTGDPADPPLSSYV
jgi:DnaK suppressor protein